MNRPAQPLYPTWLGRIAEHASLFVPLALVAMLAAILVPVPPVLLDVMIVGNLALSAVILLTTFQVRSPLDFSVFPSLLLAATLLRLVLNIASTRLILTADAADPSQATAVAGHVIQAFGDFVAGGSVVIGFVLFLVLVVVQFVVITRGATRVSEVAARFALDGMPGKQMAIDADLNAGLIDEPTARRRRDEVSREADFYGAMDGASKFVRGDAIAGLVITIVNIIGGFAVGVFDRGWPVADTLQTFTKLTIGDGLTAQVPAFITAIAAGLIVTRSSGRADLARDMTGQLASQPAALAIAAGLLVVLACLGMPPLPMLVVAAILALIAYHARAQAGPQSAEARVDPNDESVGSPVESLLPIDPLELEIGHGLVPLADTARGGDLLDRIALLRREVAREIGLVIPPVRIHDDLNLPRHGYRIKVRGQPIAEGIVRGKVGGADPTAVLTAHVEQAVRAHAPDLLTRQETEQLLGQLRERAPRLVEETIGPLIKPGDLRKVLQSLLRERVPIRDLEAIVEALADASGLTKDPLRLAEHARQALRGTICRQYAEVDAATGRRRLYCVTIDPGLEEFVAGYVHQGALGTTTTLPTGLGDTIARAAVAELAKLVAAGRHPVALTSQEVRAAMRAIVEPHVPTVAVLGYGEVERGLEVHSSGRVELDLTRAGVSPNGGRFQGALN